MRGDWKEWLERDGRRWEFASTPFLVLRRWGGAGSRQTSQRRIFAGQQLEDVLRHTSSPWRGFATSARIRRLATIGRAATTSSRSVASVGSNNSKATVSPPQRKTLTSLPSGAKSTIAITRSISTTRAAAAIAAAVAVRMSKRRSRGTSVTYVNGRRG